MKKLFIYIFFILLATRESYSKDILLADVVESNIKIRTSFSGAEIFIYGSVESQIYDEADILIVVRGPDKNFAVRGFAERQAINAPIQGSAADIIKLAMIEIYKEINLNEIKAKMLLQVHDELVFEVKEINQDILINQVKEIMETTHLKFKNFSVPLTVDYGVGKNWGEAH